MDQLPRPVTSGTSEVDPHLPLTTLAFEILLALSPEDRHGYAILRAVAERAAGAVSLHAGTLYRALARLDPALPRLYSWWRLAACGVPARRATRVDPMVALRED